MITVQQDGAVFGQRLKLARKRAGLSMQALGERTCPAVSAQAISKYEAGKMMPSSSVLVGLGKTLDVSLDFLLGSQVEVLKGVEWRKHSQASASDRAAAEALVIERLEDYLAIEEILELPGAVDPFVDLRVHDLVDESQIDEQARAIRNAWKLGLDPIPSMTALLEEKGLKTIEIDLPERINGLACHVERADGPPIDVIVVSARTNIERKRFNLAHELAHRVLTVADDAEVRKESAMNRFAGAFLIPFEHLEREIGGERHRLAWQEVMRLKRIYGVSAAAMLVRLGQSGLVPRSFVESAFKSFARTWRREEPEPIRLDEGFAALEQPRRFEGLVWHALGEQLISPVRGAQLLRQPLEAVEQGIRGPRDG